MKKFVKVTLWTALVLGVVVLGLRLTIIEWWTVPTDDVALATSLAPSLAGGDLVLLYKGKITFGDLVRCPDPQAEGRFVVGRVLGEAGDTLQVFGTDVLVNGKTTVQDSRCTESTVRVVDPGTDIPEELSCAIEAISGRKHKRASRPGRDAMTLHKTTVPEGQVFLISDDRAFPLDSRNYGAVPRASCREMVFFRVVGLKGWGDFDTRLTFIQ